MGTPIPKLPPEESYHQWRKRMVSSAKVALIRADERGHAAYGVIKATAHDIDGNIIDSWPKVTV